MTDPGFKVEGIHQDIPFRSRAVFDGYHIIGDRENAVLIEPATARGLRAAASKARPRETGGLLSGRTLRDDRGSYVLVSGFVEAGPGSGRAAAFDVSPRATARLREESARVSPTADVVGWWHSHLGPSSYSQTDLNNQSMWKQPHSVGLLIFAAGEPWANAYMGPEARDLGYPSSTLSPSPAGRPAAMVRPAQAPRHQDGRAGADGRPDADGRSAPAATMIIADPPEAEAGRSPRWSPQRRQGLVRLTVIILLLVAICLLLVLYHGFFSRMNADQQALSGQISSGELKLASQIRSGQSQLDHVLSTSGARPSISSSCVSARRSRTSSIYVCQATASGPAGKIHWKLDGKSLSGGQTIRIHVPNDGRPHQILALLKTTAGTYPGVPQTISP